MPEVDFEWVKAQLTKSKTRQNVGDAVLTLLTAWEALDLPEAAESSVIEKFSALAEGKAQDDPETTAKWFPVQIGAQLAVGDIVRVRADAFTRELGVTHNGRVGKVVAKRSGDIIVDSTDGVVPALVGTHYQANKLEVRKD